MKFKYIALKDNKFFENFLTLSEHELAAYSFANIFLWKKLYDISWVVIRGNLCVFFQDKIGMFMYLPPLGTRVDREVVLEAFKIMNNVNKNKEISRIENLEEKDIALYKSFGLKCVPKSSDYLCLKSDIAGLHGEKFKSKRASYNYFLKHYDYEYLPFILKYKDDCLKLFGSWQKQRKARNDDPVYRGMIDDTKICLETLLDNYRQLDFEGRVVKVDKQVRAFTFGYELNKEIFCVLYEITDLELKGLAQFIFCEFAGDLKYRYLNIMDDSGLENLRQVKLSYHPVKTIPAYIGLRKNV